MKAAPSSRTTSARRAEVSRLTAPSGANVKSHSPRSALFDQAEATEQLVEVDRPAPAENLRRHDAAIVRIPEPLAQKAWGGRTPIVGNPEEDTRFTHRRPSRVSSPRSYQAEPTMLADDDDIAA